MVGPPLGGAAVGLLGPVTTVVADALSYLLSAAGIRAIADEEPRPARSGPRLRGRDVLEGWRFVLTHPVLRPLLVNTVLVNGLIMATAPLLAVLMLGELGFPPWQYGLAFAVPCLGGLAGLAWLPGWSRGSGSGGCCCVPGRCACAGRPRSRWWAPESPGWRSSWSSSSR